MCVTAGITCFNSEDTIVRALESALEQAHVSQVVVVDDASTDSSFFKISNFIEEKSLEAKVVLIRHERNRGFPTALNTIIQNSSREFIAFFDDDDISFSDRISCQLEKFNDYLAKNSLSRDDIICYGYRNIIKVGCSDVDHVARSIGGETNPPVGTAVSQYFLRIAKDPMYDWGDGILGSCTMLASRVLLEKLRFDENFKRGAEIDFAIRAGYQGSHFVSVARPIITMQKTLGTHKSPKIDYQNWKNIFMKHRASYPNALSFLAALLSLYSSCLARCNKRGRSFWCQIAYYWVKLFSRILK